LRLLEEMEKMLEGLKVLLAQLANSEWVVA